MGASPWPETAKPGVTSLQDTYMVSCVWFWSLRNLQADCVQDVTSLVCDVDVFDLGAWMRGNQMWQKGQWPPCVGSRRGAPLNDNSFQLIFTSCQLSQLISNIGGHN